jgi:hypothetical protein
VGKASYQIGTAAGADVDAQRPQTITYGGGAAALSSVGRGINYALNDTGTITGGTGDATYIVTSVGVGGAVTGVNLLTPGTTYTTNAANPTEAGGLQPGEGTGLVLSTTASSGPISAITLVGDVVDEPVNVVSQIEFQALAANNPANGTPNTAVYNPSFPNGTITVLPTPAAPLTLTFTGWYRLARFPNLVADYILAVGALDCLRDNLAVYAKTYYREAQIDPVIVMRAAQSKDFLRYQAQTSRAMFNRFTLSTRPQKQE